MSLSLSLGRRRTGSEVEVGGMRSGEREEAVQTARPSWMQLQQQQQERTDVMEKAQKQEGVGDEELGIEAAVQERVVNTSFDGLLATGEMQKEDVSKGTDAVGLEGPVSQPRRERQSSEDEISDPFSPTTAPTPTPTPTIAPINRPLTTSCTCGYHATSLATSTSTSISTSPPQPPSTYTNASTQTSPHPTPKTLTPLPLRINTSTTSTTTSASTYWSPQADYSALSQASTSFSFSNYNEDEYYDEEQVHTVPMGRMSMLFSKPGYQLGDGLFGGLSGGQWGDGYEGGYSDGYGWGDVWVLAFV